MIITGVAGVWLLVRRRGRDRTEASSGVSMEIMSNKQDEKEDRFTPKKVLIYCIIVGLISAILSIFIDGLRLISMAAFVFASITIWYIFGEKFHKWQQRGKRKEKE